jgi:YD repeat-containing protein
VGTPLKLRWAVAWTIGLLFASLGQSAAALATERLGEGNSSDASLLTGPLVVSSVDALLGGQEQSAAREARHSAPQAVAERAAARFRYEGLSPARAAGEAATAFPGLVARPAASTPRLASGQRILSYATDHAAQVSLPAGNGIGMIESLAPIAAETPGGRHLPLDLRLRAGGGHFEPVRSDVAVQVPARLADGISLPAAGVSVTPVDAHGVPLAASSGALAGSTVLWDSPGPGASRVRDLSTLAKASPEGFELTTMLFSQRSPGDLYFRVHMPAGARLSSQSDGSMRIVRAAKTLATVSPVSAEDAEGSPVPVTTTLSGDTLHLTVERSGDYLYPIAVDPEVNDSQLAKTSAGKRSNWEFFTSNASRFQKTETYEGPGVERLETKGTAEYAPGEWAYWGYQTKGVSHIYEVKTETAAHNKNARLESFLELQEPGGSRETKKLLSTEAEGTSEYEKKAATLCAANASKVEECLPGSGKAKNAIHFQQSATASPGANYKFSDTMSQGIVSIAEPTGTHSTTSYNTTSPTLEFEVELEGKKQKVKRTNALYGSGVWLSKSAGALELLAKDPGIGVSLTKLEYESSAGHWTQLAEHNYLGVENNCQGVQCAATHAEFWTLPTGLPDGEQKLRYKAEEAIAGTQSLEGEGRATVKVDTAAPRGLSIAGLPFGNELSERPYKLTATAIDGSGATLASSGVKRLALFVSGREVAEVGTQTGCFVAKGECLAKAEWSINGSELGAGRHAIVIVATDNAGNESRIEETISIRHSTPVPIGPGSVDLQSGDFTLGATDVSLGSGLTVSRSYSSRATLAGAEGRLGPQWSMSLGANESIRELVDGGVLLTSASGKQSIFASLGQGKFEAPNGDSNLKLELEENKTTKEKLAYYLKNAAAGTAEKFTLPAGSRVWLPTKQEGTLATDTVTYGYAAVDHEDRFALAGSEPQPGAITTGPDGNVWVADTHNDKIDKLSQTGVVLAEYPTSGVPGPNIVTGPDGRLWFVEGEKTIGKKYTAVKMTTAGAQTEYALSGGAAYLTAGADGNMWFTDSEDKKVGKITPTGTSSLYAVPHGTPYAATAGTDGNVWFLTTNPSRIDKVTPAGVVTEMYTPPTEFPGFEAIATGSDGNVWFSETGKIDKITPAGVVTAYPLASAERLVNSITAGPDKNVWFSDNGRLGKITPAGVRTDYAVGAQSYGMTAGPDGNIWYTDDLHGTVDRSTTSGKIVEPSEILAPVPPGVSCAPEMKPGCRALHFSYGGPNGLLSGVSMEAYNPESKRMVSENVAAYRYDAKGQLAEEWDPRYAAVKVRYSYDPEGHLTALSPPGQEPWFFVYGTIQGDLGSGRLMKVSRAPASEPIRGAGEAPPINQKKPSITGSALTGVRMTTSDGEWSLAPVAYGYQWQDCDASGGACTVIAGANGSSYTPTAADVGHRIVAVVTATNSGGSATSSSEPSGVVVSRTIEFASESKPRGLTPGPVMPKGTEWYTAANSIMKEKTAEAAEAKYELPAESSPYDITAGPDGNLWYTEFSLLGKIGRITTSGVRTEFALPAFSYPDEITAGPDGKLWFTEEESGKIGKITTAGAVTEYALPAGSHPTAITSGPEGNLWFVRETKISRITTTGSIAEYALPPGSNARGIAAGSDGNLWFTEYGTDKIGKITPGGSITEYPLPSGSQPSGIVAAGDGNLWFTEYGSSKIGRITTSGAIAETPLPPGSGPLRIARGANSDLEYTDNLSSRIGHLTIGTEAAERTPSMGWTIEYGTPLTASAGLPAMTPGDVAKWGQTDDPVEATAILPPDADQGWPATSYKRATVYYLDAHGRTVNASQPSNAPYGSVVTTEFNETNDPIRTLSSDNRQAALEAGASSVEVSKLLDTQSTYNGEGAKEGEAEEPGTRLIDVEGPQHAVKYVAGGERKEALARLHTKYFYDEGAPSGTFDLVTKVSTLAHLANEEEVEVRKTTTSYSGQGNLGWKLRTPTSVTVDPEGKKVTHTTLYDATTGQVTETRAPAGAAGGSAHDTKLVYYSAAANTEGYPACGSHPEWAGLLCETLPAKQPGSAGLPPLPVTTVVSYNLWNAPLVTTEAFGGTVRTKKNTYLEADRLSGSETTSTAGASLPKVYFEYNSQTGLLAFQQTTVGETTKRVTSEYNSLGQLTKYTDADGNIAKYAYADAEGDYQLTEMTDSSAGGTTKQTYTYNATTQLPERMVDSAAGTFTAAYDAEGKLVSQAYPNGMCADQAYNAAGEAVQLEYLKTGNCAEHEAGAWFSEARTPAVRGETISRTSTLASESYAYDSLGRLTEAQETPTSEGCKTRVYAYDEESNRTSLTTRAPGAKGECTSTGGTVESHSYDEANRLIDAGIEYDGFGNVTKLPSADAEGHELSSTFYVDNAVATQSQNGVNHSYQLDPVGRVRETVSGAQAAVAHYDGPGEAVAWTSEGEGKAKRNIPGIDGSLAATQTNGETPVMQLRDLQGDVVATIGDKAGETKLLSTYNSTEFGVPNAGKAPPKFAYLGALGVESSFSTGVITYGATSYVPQTGRALQSEAVEAPGVGGGSGAGAPYTMQEEPWNMRGAARAGAEGPGLEAAREQAALEAAFAAAQNVDPHELFTLADARIKGEQFLKIATASEIISVIGSIPDAILDKVAGLIFDHFSVDIALDWYHKAGQKLVECSHLYSKGFRRCLFGYTNTTISLGPVSATFVNLGIAPEVEKCAPPLFAVPGQPYSWRCERLGENSLWIPK